MKSQFLQLGLTAALAFMLVSRVTAQAFTTLLNFQKNVSMSSPYSGPNGGLILSGNTLYGTAYEGGSLSAGMVFSIQTNGTGFTNLHNFSNGSDGAAPQGVLVLSGNTLYGTAGAGGTSRYGTVFSIQTNGTGFTTVYNFLNGNAQEGWAAYPKGLILSGNTLYGTTSYGGSSGVGTVFAIGTNGTGFMTPYNCNLIPNDNNLNVGYPNSGGAIPDAGVLLSGNNLYGTALSGGTFGYGTLFAVNTDGTGFNVLHNFTAASGTLGVYGTNSDGAVPSAGMILLGNTLYGTTYGGGTNGSGTLFAVSIGGTNFTVLHTFTATTGTSLYGYGINSDGANPSGGLIFSGNKVYGTTDFGGRFGSGTVFCVNTNGTGFTTLYNFTALSSSLINNDGANPEAELVLSGNTLYGTTTDGGSGGIGTVFSLSLPMPPPPPQLSILLSGTNVILTWSTNTTSYTVQFATNIVPPIIWTAVSPGAVIVNGQNTVTNFISGKQKYYRLSQ